MFKKQQQKQMQQKNYAKEVSQSEQALEDNLVKQLVSLGHNLVKIKDEKDLLANLKIQLEKHNRLTLTDGEFSKVLNHLNKGNVFERAKILRDKMHLEKENGDSLYLEFINQDHWCKNQFQVTQQVTMEGSYKNRYDVTLLINGLPLVQIELKRRGLELKEAFNQINRYQKHSYFAGSALFNYIQLFIISNGVNTKYYANNRHQSFKQTFYWADEHNKNITGLEEFADDFLEKCHIAKMITKYIVLNATQKILMALRPYQYYATEAIINRVKDTDKNGYIWHTTGSGKTLTSFKVSQILTKLPQVHKVVFVVDRKDLDYQTTKEFNGFSDGSVDGTDNTIALVKQFSDDTKLIVTTIQKLNTAIKNPKYLSKMEKLKHKKIVFIFDECHRSQFGETHNRIKNFFENHQMFGFTGTPIFAENTLGLKTTKDLFHDCLHKYVITDAIKDENVLKFSIEYVGRYKQKEDSQNEIDIEVEDIDTKELLESPVRLEKITDYIIANHNRKTHSRAFTALFCVSSIDTVTQYYDLFQAKKQAGKHNLRVATIFSFIANENDTDANGFIPDVELEIKKGGSLNQHSRDKLDSYIADYNKLFNTRYSTRDSHSFYNYYQDIAKKVKEKKIDILLVVNMFLTGFDSPPLNTLYVDKNLKYHGLIQAFSRTNRILDEKKSQGNIICFRNLKKNTDDAITLFSNKEAKETILVEPYENYIDKFNQGFAELLKLAPTLESVDELSTEEQELGFIKAFRELMRLNNVLSSFANFKFTDLEMTQQNFEDYKSKYLDLHDKVKSDRAKEKVSILDDVDFELELIHRDDVNVAYILRLLGNFKDQKQEDREKNKKAIIDLLTGDAKLRSKKSLIEKFINENVIELKEIENIEEIFETFWGEEKQKAFEVLCEQENLNPEKLQEVIGNYLYTTRKPLRDDIVAILNNKPKLLERKKIIKRVTDKIIAFVDIFIEGIHV
ncbi:MAG: type I restriction endonuclease subunit R [Methylococcales bacterium]|nr:type I restriction endonuclease subunit R [Methylococcales bacterium]